jgi:hypothetical protein
VILVQNDLPPELAHISSQVQVDRAQYQQTIALANTEFTRYYAESSPDPIDLEDDFDRNGQRITVAKVNERGEIVASISIVVAMRPGQKLDVEEYFDLPPRHQKEVPRFSLGRLMLNHVLITDEQIKQELTTKLYQQLHTEACDLIKKISKERHSIFAVVNDKTADFVDRSFISSTTLTRQLKETPVTQDLKKNFPKYWNRNPRLIQLHQELSFIENFKRKGRTIYDLFYREQHRTGSDVVRVPTYLSDKNRTNTGVVAENLRDHAQQRIERFRSNDADTDLIPGTISRLEQKFTAEILNKLLVYVGGEETSLRQWIDAVKSGETDYGYSLQLEEGRIYKTVPQEIDLFLRIACSIEPDGDPDRYLQLAHLYLEFSRRRKIVSFAGMSVGGEAVLETSRQLPLWGTVRIADAATWQVDNQGRAPIDRRDMGQPKVISRTRELLKAQPWTEVQAYTKGVTPENVKQFVKDAFVVVDAMDNIFAKILLRKEARERGVPLIMVSDVSDVVLEVRRFDRDKSISLFALVGDKEVEKLEDQAKKAIASKDPELINAAFTALVNAVVGTENIPADFRKNLEAFAKGDLALIPQPRATVDNAARIVASCIAQLVDEELELGEPLEDGVSKPLETLQIERAFA